MQLGGGNHLVAMEVESNAADATLLLNTGVALEVLSKVISPDRNTRLVADTTMAGAKNNIEILSAAPTTSVGVVQTVPGTLGQQLDFTTRSSDSKIGAKFDGAISILTLGGGLLGAAGRDEFKLETNARTPASLLVDAGDGNNAVDFLVSAASLATPTPLRLVSGTGDDLINLLAGAASTAVPQLNCGAGTDIAKASVGTAAGFQILELLRSSLDVLPGRADAGDQLAQHLGAAVHRRQLRRGLSGSPGCPAGSSPGG